ncbi:19471_t:CDS:2, partial [Funneliformis geosporum]
MDKLNDQNSKPLNSDSSDSLLYGRSLEKVGIKSNIPKSRKLNPLIPLIVMFSNDSPDKLWEKTRKAIEEVGIGNATY